MLRCPATGQKLFLADPTVLAAIAELVGGEDAALLSGALVCEDAKRAYAVIADIPKLLADESIPLPPPLQELARVRVCGENPASDGDQPHLEI